MNLYTKKVFQHFQNPKNMGRLKNPDGVGKVGNPTCLLPNQKIHIYNDLKEIDKILEKERVFSSSGKYDEVGKIFKRNYADNVIVLKNQLGRVSLTPEHLIFGIKIPRGDNFKRTKYRRKLISGWSHAYQFKKGDIALYPISKIENDLKYLKTDIIKSKWDFKSKSIPTKVSLDANLLRLFGYFLAEGNVQDKPSKTFITFSLNINENEIIKDITKITDRIFKLGVAVKKIPARKTAVVSIYSAGLARLFKRLFGNGAAKKKMPDFIMDLPAEKQKSLIYGLWKGDGYVNLNRDGPRAGYSTISYALAQQMKILLLRQKIVPSFYTEKAKVKNGVTHLESYRIHVGQRESLMKLCSILDLKYKPKSYISEKAWFNNGFLYLPITDIENKYYQGTVHNLEVKNSHSFVSEAFCLHNCGDVMWLYIKIGKNKKDQEIIKDIKFETFGCVAAIATSSVITDLAMGKTVEQAMKISKAQVVKSLGGLPPIKLHCSVLAADALLEAIYDYLQKNKKEISLDLQKRHEIILKSKESIEHRYHDWINLEEQLRHKKK